MQGIYGAKSKTCLFLIVICIFLSFQTQADWKDRFAPAKVVTLSQVKENPATWLNIPVRMTLRFNRVGNIYNPFFTLFTSAHYINFSAWGTEEHIWKKKVFYKPYSFFYIHKENPEYKTFLRIKPFETVCILAKPIGLFRGKPYLRVVWICRMPGNLGVYNLRMLNLGMKAFEERKFTEAETHFQQVLHTNPPADIRVMLYKVIAKILMYDKKNIQAALVELKKARKISPRDYEVRQLMKDCRYYLKNRGKGASMPIPVYIKQKRILKEKAKDAQNKDGKGKNTQEVPKEVTPKEVTPKTVNPEETPREEETSK